MWKKEMRKDNKPERTNLIAASPQVPSLAPSPRIFLIDFKEELSKKLNTLGLETFSGSLGKIVKVPNTVPGNGFCCLPNNRFPANAHEYEIVVANLVDAEVVEFVQSDHKKSAVKGEKDLYLYCRYPTTRFDPRGLASSILTEVIGSLEKKHSVVMVFAGQRENVAYNIVSFSGRSTAQEGTETHSNYDMFSKYLPSTDNKTGTRVQLSKSVGVFRKILEKYLPTITYHIVFDPPQIWENRSQRDDPSFVSLLENADGEIISYIQKKGKLSIFVFPDFEDKESFALDMFRQLPDVLPEVFPFTKKSSWLDTKEYFLPNQSDLEQELIDNERRFLENRSKIEERISENKKRFAFLHGLLVETGDALVLEVISFLEWLGFEKIVNCDQQKREIKEEDIQVETTKGLLVVEVKGIAGTSKDDECSQIAKIKFRRAEERQRFDVFGLYIVNHQRMLPPHLRTNPPFTENQLKDALHDKRGLLSTWTLFCLYFEIEQGVLTKDEARERLFDYGLVAFVENTRTELGKVHEIFQDGLVAITNVSGKVSKGDKLFVKDRYRFDVIEVVSLQLDGKETESAETGEVGIKLSKRVKVGTVLYRV